MTRAVEQMLNGTRWPEQPVGDRSHDRPGLAACFKAIQPGNTLVLWRLDRLNRDLRDLVNTVEDVRTRSIGLKVMAGAGRRSTPPRPTAANGSPKAAGQAVLDGRDPRPVTRGQCGRTVNNN